MADITAKRGPIDPNKYINDQGIASQAVLKEHAAEAEFRRKKKLQEGSTWDKIGSYISTAGKIAGTAMDLYSKYQTNFGDTSEEGLAVEEQKASRNKQEANNTKQASALSSEAITSKLEKNKEEQSLTFKKKIESAIDANNEEDVVKYALEDIKGAKENKDLLEQIAQYYEWNGHQQSADLIRGAYSGHPENMSLDTSGYNLNVANPEQYNKYLSYKDNVGALSGQLMAPINSGKLANLGLSADDPDRLASDLLTTCDLEITDTNDYNLDKNEFTSTINGKENVASMLNSPSENTYQTPAKNIQFLKVSKKTPLGARTEIFTIDPSAITTVPYRDKNGVYTQDQETDYGSVVSKIVAQGLEYKEKAKKKYNVPELSPAITTQSVNKEQTKLEETSLAWGINAPVKETKKETEKETKNILDNNKKLKQTVTNNLKIDKDKFEEGVIKDARIAMNDKDKRHNLLRILSIPDKWYDKVPISQKAAFLKACVVASHTRRNKQEIDEFKDELRGDFNL
jgi:hypothetical protein